MTMQLVKDLSDIDIVFYWIDEAGEIVSPQLYSLPVAEEWYKRFVFSLYDGRERRRSIVDRRSNDDRRKNMDRNQRFGRRNPAGRRAADKPVYVSIDLTKDKLKQLYC